MFRQWFGRSASRPLPARRSYRPALEALDNRLTPAGTVTGAFLNGTWTLTGDSLSNQIVVNSTGTAGAFSVGTGANPTLVTGDIAPTGVKRIIINFDDGNDGVIFNNIATPITLNGLTINGGVGDNNVSATDLTIKGNLAITNLNGFDQPNLTNLIVKKTLAPNSGKVSINNGDGGSITSVRTNAAQFSSIARTLTIINGNGTDSVSISDTSIGGSIINHNGTGDSSFLIRNFHNTLTRAVIGGSITATSTSGTVSVEVDDAVVKGNVTANTGSGLGLTSFDSVATTLPVVVKGKVTITGSGTIPSLAVGTTGNHNGLRIGKSLTINWNGEAGILNVTNLFVTGRTTIT